MQEKIESITEAFSMQPNTLRVCVKDTDYPDYPNKGRVPHVHTDNCIKEINMIQTDQYEFEYHGFNFNNKRMFVYQARSINVHYFTK